MNFCFLCGQECASEVAPCSDCAESADVGQLADAIYGFQSQKASMDHKIDACKALIKSKMEPRSQLVQNGYRVSWRSFTQQRLDFNQFKMCEPELFGKFSKEIQIDSIYVDPVR